MEPETFAWHPNDEAEFLSGPDENPGAIHATPFGWPAPGSIPARRWLFGYWLLRGEITAIVAPGGVGKSTFTTALALSLASGVEFLDKPLHDGACTAWLWNLEDDKDELDRQVTACGLHHGVGPDECGKRLYVDSGLNQRLCTAIEDDKGFRLIEPVYSELKVEIERRGVDLLIVDPFVSSHEIPENDNVKIDKVAKRWKRLASETGSAIALVHHTKKMGGREVKAEDSRGAVALINTARSTLVLNPMTTEEAERFGISDKAEQRRMVRVDDDKPNRAPPESAWWFRKASVDLGNGKGFKAGDSVGAAMPWTPPDPFDGISTRDLYDVQLAIDDGDWADSIQAKDWAGHAAAKVLRLDMDDATAKNRVKSLLKTWKQNGALAVEKRPTAKGRDKPFVIVGDWVDPASLPTLKSGVGESGKSGASDPEKHYPTPLSIEGGGGGGVDSALPDSRWGK
ncbi:MAG: AAA family ATPase [Caenibius sp.]